MSVEHYRRGFTLIEMMVVIAMIAIIASWAIPSFVSTVEKYRTKGVAENLYTDLVNMRSASIKLNQTVFFALHPGADWCYGISSNAACDCKNSPATCLLGTEQRVVSYTDYPDLSVSTSGFTPVAHQFSFSPRNSLPDDDGVISVTHDNGKVIKVVVNPIGRVGICSDDYTGYGGC